MSLLPRIWDSDSCVSKILRCIIKNPFREPPNQDLACNAQIYAAILRKLLEDIIQKSEQDSISQEPRDEEGEDFQDHNDFSGSGNNMHCRRND